MRRIFGWASALSIATLAAGFGGTSAGCGGAPSVTVASRVAVTITPRVDTLPFDPRSARITAAANELADLLGHPLSIDIDAAMVPEFRSSFEDALGRSFENVTRDFTELKKRSPAVFDHTAPLFEHVSVRYDATKRKDEVTFDENRRTLEIAGPASRGDLVPAGTVRAAAEKAYAARVGGRFAQASADSVRPEERRAYFDWLTGRTGRAAFRNEEPRSVDQLANAPNAARVLTVLRLRELSSGADPTLASDAERWLLSEVSWFQQNHVHRAALVRELPTECTFRRAERALASFLVAAHPRVDDEQKLAIERAFFVRSFTTDRAAQDGRSYSPYAWPSVDRFAFALGIIDAWRAAGHPSPLSTPRVTSWQEFMACPKVMDGSAHVVPRCDYDFYRFALESADGRKRLTAALLDRRDPVFAQTAFASFSGASANDAFLPMLRGVERSPEVYRAGMRVLAERSDNATDRTLLEEAQRVWLERPEHRGIVLYLLAHLDRYDHGNVDWRGFEDAFGGKVTAGELTSYLAEGPLALALLPIAWPALGRFPRAEHLVPRLDALLDENGLRRAGSSVSSYNALASIVGRLCAEKSVADLAAVRRYLQDRVARHPGEPYGTIADEATAEACRPAPPGPPPRNEVRLVNGKKRLRIIQGGERGLDDR